MRDVILLALLGVCLHQVHAGYRILGFKREIRTSNSATVLDTEYYLTTSSLGSGESWVLLTSHFCWAAPIDDDGYCYTYVKVTQAAGVQHYQLVGYKVKQQDSRSRYTYNWIEGGHTGETFGVLQQYVAEGFAWVGSGYDDWGYQRLYLYLNQTTDPPLVQAFQTRERKAGPPTFKDPVTTGSTYDATEWHMCDFRAWTSDWGDGSEKQVKIWITKTVLKGMRADFDNKEVSSNSGDESSKFRSRTIINDRCGETYVEGMTGTLTDSVSYSVTTTAGWTQEFSFGFSISVEASGDIGVVSTTLTATAETSFSLTESLERTVSETQTRSYQWPTYCPPGYKCITTTYITNTVYKIPVIFTFEREGQQFDITNTLIEAVEEFQDDTTEVALAPNEQC